MAYSTYVTPVEDSATSESLVFNGIDLQGHPLLVTRPEEIASVARAVPMDPAHLRDLALWKERFAGKHLDVRHGIEAKKLEECGWGLLRPEVCDPEILHALDPLLELRRRQATQLEPAYYRELTYRPGDTKLQFLARHGIGADPVDPAKLPYYLLILGDPQQIPFSFQYQLDVQYAVGRLCFDTPEEYGRYAAAVVAAEEGRVRRQRRLEVVATANPEDPATRRSLGDLAVPLSDHLADHYPAWAVARSFGEEARKQRWLDVLAGQDSPALVFSASHGLQLACGDKRQRELQGALVCQEWPGPTNQGQPLDETHYLAARDIGPRADVAGLVAFHFGCFSAGTPTQNSFWRHSGSRGPLAREPFVARLPQHLLAHPGGGALAVIGHVDQAWSCSFTWQDAGRQLVCWESALGRLLDGYPVGAAMEPFDQRYAEVACDLTQTLDDIDLGEEPDPVVLTRLWTAAHDARSYMVLGDPAVRLAIDFDPAAATTSTREPTT